MKKSSSALRSAKISAGLLKWHRVTAPTAPRCGAHCRTNGMTCQRVGLENGRCYMHGGLTPKGDQWHKPKWPKADSPRFEDKLARKVKDRERAAQKRAERVAAMTPEERSKFEAWHQARKPGSAIEREARRQRTKKAREIRELLSKPADTKTRDELHSAIETAERLVADLESQLPKANVQNEVAK